MIAADKRKAVFLLHQDGMGMREMTRRLGIGRNTLKRILALQGEMPNVTREEKHPVDPELLRRLYEQCDGWVQRVHEKLCEEENIAVPYQTLTRKLRSLGISTVAEERCDRVPDEPGAEMQHDTSIYTVLLGGQRVRVVASLLYLRYSKRRYLKFSHIFTRFKMKCFFHEALTFWGYAAPECIIDNTNLARLRGCGAEAVIVPEMEAFGKTYGFHFKCHEKNHPDRKAGEERSFYTVETNFLPGRTFESLEDMNVQALEWATVRMEQRPQTKARLIPAKVFEHEYSYLIELPEHLPSPYLLHERDTDQYGFIAFAGNFYWVPGTKREIVKVIEYGDQIHLCLGRECVAQYMLPTVGIRNQQFSPPGQPAPRSNANNRKRPTLDEEKRLRALSPGVDAYLSFALKPMGIARHRFIRELYALSKQMTLPLFIQTVERALHYRVTGIATLWRIAQLYLNQGDAILPSPSVDEKFKDRATYQDGCLTDTPDFTAYDQLLEDENKEEDKEENDG